MTLEDSIKATKHGAYAAFASAGFTTLIVLVALGSNGNEALAYWSDPFIFLDVLLISCLGIGMLRKSRTAAALAFVYHIVSQIIIRTDLQNVFEGGAVGIGVAAVLLFFYGKAFMGAVNYHKLQKEEDSLYMASTTRSMVLSTIAVIAVAGMLGLSLSLTFGVTLPTKILTGDEIPESYIDELLAYDIIHPNDEILYLYPHGMNDLLESGNILTDGHVILYGKDENDQMVVYELPTNEVTEVITQIAGNSFQHSEYKVVGSGEERWLTLFLSAELNRDKEFITTLNNMRK